jgi:hypothetical protein
MIQITAQMRVLVANRFERSGVVSRTPGISYFWIMTFSALRDGVKEFGKYWMATSAYAFAKA